MSESELLKKFDAIEQEYIKTQPNIKATRLVMGAEVGEDAVIMFEDTDINDDVYYHCVKFQYIGTTLFRKDAMPFYNFRTAAEAFNNLRKELLN